MYSKIGVLVSALGLFLVWLVMNETLSFVSIGLGILVTVACLWTTNRLLGFRYSQVFFLPPLNLLQYLAFLFKEIYRNGIRATIMIIKGDAKPNFVTFRIHKDIKNEFLHNMLASSITLTPGTVTVENKKGVFTVLSVHAEEKNPQDAFEPLLLSLENAAAKYTKKNEV